jgi:hypothetical protein
MRRKEDLMDGKARAEVIDELSGWNVVGGLLTMALFPLALPLLVLTVAAVIPLALVGVAGGLVVAAVAAPVLLARSLWRRATRARLSDTASSALP